MPAVAKLTPSTRGLDILNYVSELACVRDKLATLDTSLVFDHTDPTGAAFLIALVIHDMAKKQAKQTRTKPKKEAVKKTKGSVTKPSTEDSSSAALPHRRFWVFAPHLRAQEQLYNDLSLWIQDIPIFFLPEQETNPDALTDPELAAERLNLLHRLSSPPQHGDEIIILTQRSLQESVPRPETLLLEEAELKVGGVLDENQFIASLEEAGFERVPQVVARQQWARRGGIIDFFPPQSKNPVRLELFGDEIESIRPFDVESQISIGKLEKIRWVFKEPEGEVLLESRLSEHDITFSTEGTSFPADVILSQAPIDDREGEEDFTLALYSSPLGLFEAGDFVLNDARRALAERQLTEWRNKGWSIYFFLAHEHEEERCRELFFSQDEHHEQQNQDPPSPPSTSPWSQVHWVQGDLARGFSLPSAKLAVLTSNELFGRYQLPAVRIKADREDKARRHRAQADLTEIHPGDLVVHLRYGIGRFLRMETNATTQEEEMLIEYKDGVLLRLPLSHAFLVSRYIGLGTKTPKLNALGDKRWASSCSSAQKSIADYAAKLLRIQAERETKSGHPHPPDSRWMLEFESTFPFRETQDQLRAIHQTKADMEAPTAMDRLICGDVGFGKTEVALRAAFKCITGGKQAVMLAPTTILAEQHYRNFRARMSEYPVRVELLSRLCSEADTRRILVGLADGSIDMVIGTHRLISNDVVIKNPGLVIIDEEQRFGVQHKEKFKEKFHSLDIISLSATPIPRTLYLALMGARDMSTIDTPPLNRRPVATTVCSYDDRLIKRVVERELARGGQVYFLHNRVKTIELMRTKLQTLLPEARIVIGHGQMDKHELEDVMHTFINGQADILLATTIIESGIDIPNANTIIIDRADRFGLADLYQLRGRVGRAGHQAYAYLLLPSRELTTGDARRRINAIKQYTELGSGFKIAMRDLEIRGAGNLLGTQQSGHIAAIGFDLYCKLLKQSVDVLKGHRIKPRVDCTLKADFLIRTELDHAQAQKDGLGRATVGAYIPRDYIPENELRMSAYKELAQAESVSTLDTLERHWRDRFGKLPAPAQALLLCTKIRVIAGNAQITEVEIKDDRLMLLRNNHYIHTENKQFPRLKQGVAAQKLQEAYDLLLTL